MKQKRLERLYFGLFGATLALLNFFYQENKLGVHQTFLMNKQGEASDLTHQMTKESEAPIDSEASTVLRLYTTDPGTYDAYPFLFFEKIADQSLDDHLEGIGHKLSESCFDGLGIEVLYLNEEKGSACINLYDSETHSWENFFQGSTGGLVTEQTLIDSFLQPHYKGEDWINEVRFLYDEKPIVFDHVPRLQTVNTRN